MLTSYQLILFCVLSLLIFVKSTDYSTDVVHSKLRRVAKLLEIDDDKVNSALNQPTKPHSQQQPVPPPTSNTIHGSPTPTHTTKKSGNVSWFLFLGIIVVLLLLLLVSFKRSFHQKPKITSINEKESPEITSKNDKESTEITSKNKSSEITSKNGSTEITSKNESTEIISKKESTDITSKKDNESTEITSKKDNESPEMTSKNQNLSDNNNNKEFYSKTNNSNQLISHEIFSSFPKVTDSETSLGFCHEDAKQLLQKTVYDIEKFAPENRRTEMRIQVLYLNHVMAKTQRKEAVTLLKEDLIRKKTKLVENQNQELVQKRRDAEITEKKNTAKYILFLTFASGFLSWFLTLQYHSTTFSFSHVISTLSWWFTFLKVNISIPYVGNIIGLNTALTNLFGFIVGFFVVLLYLIVLWFAPKIGFSILLGLFSSMFTTSIFLLVICLIPVMLVVYLFMYKWLTTPLRIFVIGLISLSLGLVAGYCAARLDPLKTEQNLFGYFMNIDKLEEL